MSMPEPPLSNSQGGNPFGESNPFSDNPYAPPPSAATGSPSVFYATPAQASNRKLVGHVPVIAVLMMVQGGLELLMGASLIAMAGILPMLMKMEGQPGNQGPPPEFFAWIMLVIYGGLGLLTIVAAVLHFYAGLRNYRFRNRTLGLVALAGGMVTVFTCYCAPTSIALAVYGLIVYLNADVAQAFELGESGQSKEDLLQRFRAPPSGV
jgi:hypothetical protein